MSERERESDFGAICPYCDHEHKASDFAESLYDEGDNLFECAECGKVFEVEPYCSWSWTTRPVDEEYDESEDEDEC